jgi:hypothetical protein
MKLAAILLLCAGPVVWNFEKDEAGKPPAGFDFVTTAQTPAGKWVIVTDGDNKVLAQTDTDKTDRRFALALAKEISLKDVKLGVRAKPISGEVDQAAGLVWRCKDQDNYYLVRSNVLEGNVRLYKIVNGNRSKFAGKEELKLKAGEWHSLRVEHKGTSIAVFLNDQKIIEAEDKTLPDAGRIGVWTKADSVTWFDDLSVDEMK